MDTRRLATHCGVFSPHSSRTSFSQTAPQEERGDPLTPSHRQRCGLCRDVVTVLRKQTNKQQKCVVRVCEFVDRVSQSYFSSSFFFFFFFLNFILRCPFYGLNQQVCAPALLVYLLDTLWVCRKTSNRTVHLADWVPTRVRFWTQNSSDRLSRISVFMQWWNVNAVLDAT